MAIDRVGKIEVVDGDRYSRGTEATFEVKLSQPRLDDEIGALEQAISDELDETFPYTSLSPILRPVDSEGQDTTEPTDRVVVEIDHDFWATRHLHGADINSTALKMAIRTALDLIDTETRAAEGQRRRWGAAIWQFYCTRRSNISYKYPWRDAERARRREARRPH